MLIKVFSPEYFILVIRIVFFKFLNFTKLCWKISSATIVNDYCYSIWLRRTLASKLLKIKELIKPFTLFNLLVLLFLYYFTNINDARFFLRVRNDAVRSNYENANFPLRVLYMMSKFHEVNKLVIYDIWNWFPIIDSMIIEWCMDKILDINFFIRN